MFLSAVIIFHIFFLSNNSLPFLLFVFSLRDGAESWRRRRRRGESDDWK
jgi:hypothetical protein